MHLWGTGIHKFIVHCFIESQHYLESVECSRLPTLSVHQHWVLWACTMFKQGVTFTFPTAQGHFMSLCGILVILINICIISFVVCDVSIIIIMDHTDYIQHRTLRNTVCSESPSNQTSPVFPPPRTPLFPVTQYWNQASWWQDNPLWALVKGQGPCFLTISQMLIW